MNKEEMIKAGLDPTKIRIEKTPNIPHLVETKPEESDELEKDLEKLENDKYVDITFPSGEVVKCRKSETTADVENEKLSKEATKKLISQLTEDTDKEEIPERQVSPPIEIPVDLKNKEKTMSDLKQIDIRAASVNNKLDEITVKMNLINSLSIELPELMKSLNTVLAEAIKTIKTLSSIKINE